MTPSEDLARHALLKHLLEELKPVLKASAAAQARRPKEKQGVSIRRNLSKKQTYLVDVFGCACYVTNAVERMELAGRLLFLSPTSLGRGRRPISKTDWTDYHFAAFTASLSSVLDTALLLTVEVYQLGLPAAQCTPQSVLKNSWVVGSPVAKELKALEQLLGQHRERRNRHLHRGHRADFGDLTGSVHLTDLRSMTLLDNVGEGVLQQDVLKFLWRLELQALRPKVKQITTDITRALQEVLSALEAPLKVRAQLYSRLDEVGKPTP